MTGLPTPYIVERMKSSTPTTRMAQLRSMFPEGRADDHNFVLFSTSGVHGSYRTIDDIEDTIRLRREGSSSGDDDDTILTFMVVRPRICSLVYGTVEVALDDLDFLRELRRSSTKAVGTIGWRLNF